MSHSKMGGTPSSIGRKMIVRWVEGEDTGRGEGWGGCSVERVSYTAFGAMIGLLETEEGRRICIPTRNFTSSARRSLQAFSRSFGVRKYAPQRHWQPCDRPAHPSCLSARCRLAFQHDAHNACSKSSRALPSWTQRAARLLLALDGLGLKPPRAGPYAEQYLHSMRTLTASITG
jgi:hypothetical protein